jgi:putative SbcD/Mre11-related phosphoesterase
LREIFAELDGMFSKLDREKVKIKEIVLLGDLKHEFGLISDSEWRDVSRLINYLSKKCEKLIVLKGNHDIKLGPILRKKEIELEDFYKKSVKGKNYRFIHGDKLFKQVFGQGLDVRQTNRQTLRQEILIMGHLHPSISLSDEYKKERYKCFLKGNWKEFTVYILPSFRSVGFGYDIRNLGIGENSFLGGKGKISGKKVRKHDFFIIPDKDLMKFEVVVYDESGDRWLGFGKIKKLIKK